MYWKGEKPAVVRRGTAVFFPDGDVYGLDEASFPSLFEQSEPDDVPDLDVRVIHVAARGHLNGVTSNLLEEEDDHVRDMETLAGSGLSSNCPIPGVLLPSELDPDDRRRAGISIPGKPGFAIDGTGGRHSDTTTIIGIMAADGSQSS